MKQRIVLLLLFVLVCFSVQSSAFPHKGIEPGAVRLEKNGEQLHISYTVHINKGKFSKCESLFFDLYLENGEERIELPAVAVHGKLRRHSYKRMLAIAGADEKEDPMRRTLFADRPGEEQLPYDSSFPYAAWMDGAILYARQVEWGCGDHISETTVELAKFILPQPSVVAEPEPEPVVVPQSLAVIGKEKTVSVEFPVGKSTIDPNYGANRFALATLGELIHEIDEDPQAIITGVEITGYASPEGSYRINERLSRERAGALLHHLNVSHPLRLSPGQVRMHSVAEDWEGLSQLIRESDLMLRNDILLIIDESPTEGQRKQRLAEFDGGGIYHILKDRFLPKLRRTECRILYQTEE